MEANDPNLDAFESATRAQLRARELGKIEAFIPNLRPDAPVPESMGKSSHKNAPRECCASSHEQSDSEESQDETYEGEVWAVVEKQLAEEGTGALYGGRTTRQTEWTFKNKRSRAIGVVGVAHRKSRRRLRKRIRWMNPAEEDTGALYGGRAMRKTEWTLKNKRSWAIGVAGVSHWKSRRRLRKRIRRMKQAEEGT